MPDLLTMVMTSTMVLMAATVQGAVGFGFSLIAVPLLSIYLPIQTVVPIIVCCSLVNNMMVAYEARQTTNIKRIWPMMVFGILGIPIGVYALTALDTSMLKLAVGVVIVLTSLAMFFGFSIRLKRESAAMGMAGFLSGILNGSLSMSGPPVVLFMSNQRSEKNAFRANLALYSIVTNVITIALYMSQGILSVATVPVLSVNLIGLIFGTAVGIAVSKKIKEVYFRKTVLTLMTVIGVITIINTLQ